MKFQWNKQYNDAILIALVVIFPIVLIGEPFADDFNRMTGVRDYSLDGRYLTNVIFRFLSQDTFLFNFAPLPQIMGIVIYSITLMFIVRKVGIFDRLQSGLLLLVALTAPYMLAVYPYNYDTLSICISFSIFSLTPFMFNIDKLNYKNKQMYISLLYKIIILIVAFLLYQGTLPTFIIFSLFLYITEEKNGNNNLVLNFVSILFSYLIHRKIILELFNDALWYKEQSHIDFSSIHTNIINNLLPFASFAFDRYMTIILIPIALIIFFSIYAMIKKDNTLGIINKLKSLLFIPVILFITIIFVSIISPKPENLHLRLYMSISSALFCLSIIGFKYLKSKLNVYIYSIATALVVLFCFADLYNFSYAFKLQKEYEKMLITTLYDGFHFIDKKLNKDKYEKETSVFFICQNDCLNPYSNKLINKKPYMSDLFYNKTIFNFYEGMNSYFSQYNIQENVSSLEMSNIFLDEILDEDKKVFTHYLYDIYLYDIYCFPNTREIYIIVK